MKSEEEKLWDTFSKYIRLRDSDENGWCKCISCDKPFFWKEGDAGHFISRNRKITKFNEHNNNAQCQACNRFGNGQQYLYSVALDKKYGKGTAEFLSVLSHTSVKVLDIEYKYLHNGYKLKVKALLREKGL